MCVKSRRRKADASFVGCSTPMRVNRPAQEGKCPLRLPERTESPIDHLRDEDEEAKRPLVRLLGGVGTISPAFSSAALVIEGPNSS